MAQSRSRLTPAQALAAARAAAASRNSSDLAVAVASRTSEGVISTRERAAEWGKGILRALLGQVDPYDGDQVSEFTTTGAGHLATAQKATATAAAAGQIQLLSSMGVRVSVRPTNPVDVRASGATFVDGHVELAHHDTKVRYRGQEPVDLDAAAMTTVEVLNRPVRTIRYLESQGATRERALAGGYKRLDALVEGNVMLAQRIAESEVINAAANLAGSPVVGMRRIIHPEMSRTGTCGLCIAASDRLYTVRELLPIHAGCWCTSAAVTEEFDPADELNAVDLRRLYRDAGGTSAAHLKRTRYKVDEHGELGPTLIPVRKYKPRSKTSEKQAGGTAVMDEESKVEVARRQLPLFEANLAKLREQGLDEDSSQVKYHKEQIAKYQERLAADSGPPRQGPPNRSAASGPTTQTKANTPPGPPRTPNNGGVAGGEDDDNDPLGRYAYASPASEQRSLNRLTQQERVAIESFATNNYERVNAALRQLREMTPDIQHEVDVIRAGLRKYPLDHDVRVTREVSGAVYGIVGPDAAEAVEDIIGQVFDEPGFMSTSMAATPAHSERHEDPLTLDLLVPAGTPALAVGELSEYPMEREMLLIDARQYEIVGARYDQAQKRWRLFGLVDPEE